MSRHSYTALYSLMQKIHTSLWGAVQPKLRDALSNFFSQEWFCFTGLAWVPRHSFAQHKCQVLTYITPHKGILGVHVGTELLVEVQTTRTSPRHKAACLHASKVLQIKRTPHCKPNLLMWHSQSPDGLGIVLWPHNCQSSVLPRGLTSPASPLRDQEHHNQPRQYNPAWYLETCSDTKT